MCTCVSLCGVLQPVAGCRWQCPGWEPPDNLALDLISVAGVTLHAPCPLCCSYFDAVLNPIVAAISSAVAGSSGTQVWLTMQGEMGATAFFHPQRWQQVAADMRSRMAGSLPSRCAAWDRGCITHRASEKNRPGLSSPLSYVCCDATCLQ